MEEKGGTKQSGMAGGKGSWEEDQRGSRVDLSKLKHSSKEGPAVRKRKADSGSIRTRPR